MNSLRMFSICILASLLGQTASLSQFSRLSYFKLPSYNLTTNQQEYKLFGGTAEESSYDVNEQILYVVGEESYVLHIIDMSNPRIPSLLMEHRFLPTDGVPRDVEVCGSRVAVSISSPVEVYDGHVMFFTAYTRASQTFNYLSQLPVGAFPDNIRFTPNCAKLVIANEARHGKDPFDRFADPEGTISIITFPSTGSPSERIVNFNKFNDRRDIRHVSAYAPDTYIMRSTLAQDIEPEYIAITRDGSTAYVTLQENNAIAQVDLKSGLVLQVYPLGYKDWSNLQLDTSDRDGGIHMRSYPIRGLYQPDGIKTFNVGRRTYLVTINEGSIQQYTEERDGITWSDGVIAKSLTTGNKLNEVAINNQTFIDELGQDSKLGHLAVSQIDGSTLYGLEDIYAYGGRGFSIWDTTKMASPIYDSGDEIERVDAQAFKGIFNTDCADPASQSPETLKDTSSVNMGPKLNALDVVNDNGTIYMVVGSETTGIIYLYIINKTTLTAELQHVRYEGGYGDLWNELYDNNQAGNAHISDIRIIPANDSPNNNTLVYVIGGASGSVAIYQIIDKPSVSKPIG